MPSDEQRPSGSGGQTGDASRQPEPNRRHCQRVLLNLEVDYLCEDTFLFAYITDMSVMGIFIRTNAPEPPGTALNLQFTLPGERAPLELEGEVIWVNEFRPGDFSSINPGMGVRFCEIDTQQRRRIRRVIRTFAYLDSNDYSPESDPTGEAI